MASSGFEKAIDEHIKNNQTLFSKSKPQAMEGCVLKEKSFDPHCGCLEEEWDTPVGIVFLHIMPNGCGEAHFDNGSSHWDIELSAENEFSFRKKLEDYIHNLPCLEEL